MQFNRLWIHATLSLVFAACATDPMNDSGTATELDTQTSALSGAVKPTTGYFSFRRDERRCASPLCGGYFVASVNELTTRCADGSLAAECYVATLDLPKGIAVEAGDLLHGTVSGSRHSKKGKKKPKLGAFVADFVVSPVLNTPAESPFLLAFDTGVRCITTPCPSMGLTALNTGAVQSTIEFAFSNEAVEDAFFSELGTDADAGTGAIMVGTVGKGHGRGKKGRKSAFHVRNVYVTKGKATGSCSADADCSAGFCGWDEANKRICKPWAQRGERCEGRVLPSARAFCEPGLVCKLLDPTGDTGGICQR